MGFAEHKINCYGYFKILEDNLKIMCKNKKKYKKIISWSTFCKQQQDNFQNVPIIGMPLRI